MLKVRRGFGGACIRCGAGWGRRSSVRVRSGGGGAGACAEGALIERVRGAGGGAENVGMGACAARTVQERPDVHKKAPTP